MLNFIKHFIETYDYAPTYKEIGEKFQFTRARAGALIAEFRKLNLIKQKQSGTQKYCLIR